MRRSQGEDPPRKQSSTLRKLAEMLISELPAITSSMAMLGIYCGVTLTIPRKLGGLVDVKEGTPKDEIKKQCRKLITLFLVGGISNFGRLYLAGSASERIISKLRASLFTKLVQQPVEFYDCEDNRTTELVQRLQNDTEKIGKMVTETLLQGVKNIVQTVGSLIIMFTISPQVAMMLLLTLPPVGLSAAKYGRYAKGIEHQISDEHATSGVTASEILSNIKLVFAFNQQQASVNRYEKLITDIHALSMKGIVAASSYQSFLQTSGYLVVLSLLYTGSIQVSNGKLTVGRLTSLLLHTMFGGVGIMGIGNFVADIMRGVGIASRTFELLKEDFDEVDGDDDVRDCHYLHETHMLPRDSVGGEITVSHVSFAYPSRPKQQVWKDVSFSIPSGSCCAVIGHSGSGKSTLVNMLLRFYTPASGSISLEHVDISNVTAEQIRNLVSYVPQDPLLIAGSILDNILFGVPIPEGDDPEKIAISAAKKTNIHDFIVTLPNGYETWVGERGALLSGGQRQRIAISRALAKEMCGQSRIMIFDEATTGLDPANKRALQSTIKSVMLEVSDRNEESRRRTIICITHDEELLRCCDHVVALQNGEVAISGSANKLGDLSQYLVNVPVMDEKTEGVNLTCQ